ncbi:hypothetical protein BU14_0285s0030 [Porphyra umbilicalis]|uniref:Uncharacterized protein n=1 Tax=Porphyra umbilicalis TaxID=2786 RepID=A0A1X6P102_PORUM|nr:hypothetical protein BU14_0285s0030 [Porphyra umbilicalis]|eukprot:OSX74542.1 hypothetical protein BU14_0285s0030 [Porphyra umbilicalis]
MKRFFGQRLMGVAAARTGSAATHTCGRLWTHHGGPQSSRAARRRLDMGARPPPTRRRSAAESVHARMGGRLVRGEGRR